MKLEIESTDVYGRTFLNTLHVFNDSPLKVVSVGEGRFVEGIGVLHNVRVEHPKGRFWVLEDQLHYIMERCWDEGEEDAAFEESGVKKALKGEWEGVMDVIEDYAEGSLAYALGDVLLGVQLPIDVPHIPAGVTITERHLLNLSSFLVNEEWEPEENPITKKIKNIVEVVADITRQKSKGIKIFKHYADNVEQVRGVNGNKHWRNH